MSFIIYFWVSMLMLMPQKRNLFLGSQKPGCFHNSPIIQHKKNFKFKNSSITPSYQHVLAQRHPRSNMKYLTGLLQSPAVLTSTVDVSTARLCNNPVKYFTVKKFASLAIISQNPGFIEIQVLELFCNAGWAYSYRMCYAGLRVKKKK